MSKQADASRRTSWLDTLADWPVHMGDRTTTVDRLTEVVLTNFFLEAFCLGRHGPSGIQFWGGGRSREFRPGGGSVRGSCQQFVMMWHVDCPKELCPNIYLEKCVWDCVRPRDYVLDAFILDLTVFSSLLDAISNGITKIS